MTIGMAVILLLAGADLAGEACGPSCKDLQNQSAIPGKEARSSGTECGTMTLQFKVGGKAQEKEQKVCEIRVRQR